ncbi:hypothetical protein [Agaribacter flavus]|uniref:YcxB-like protein domain-containing protein n=1 Tax=Agaribacter flavus TaxID=1902781 RepID=A0ABV7FNE1_9ALTE
MLRTIIEKTKEMDERYRRALDNNKRLKYSLITISLALLLALTANKLLGIVSIPDPIYAALHTAALFMFIFVTFYRVSPYFDHPYSPDPYDYLKLDEETLYIGKDAIPLQKINKVVITKLPKVTIFSLPYNHVGGKPPTFYFDHGFYLSLHNYVKKHLPNVEFID